MIKTVQTAPISGQKPGTSGLRKQTTVFMEPGFLENYVQAIWTGIGGAKGATLIVGGDGRFFNDCAIQTIIKMAAAEGVARLIIGQDGLLSTPAASHLIRLNGADGGLILSASHNPGGPKGDFGLKFNGANGGPASEAVTDKIYAATQNLEAYQIADGADVDLATLGQSQFGGMEIEIVDPVADYAALMESLFDFDAISALFQDGFRMCFDAMHAVTGPYAHAILETRLGAAKGTVINGTPSPDFGGGHPDPNPIWAKELMAMMFAPDAPDFGAASDGDGDRNMIVGRHIYVSPSDSLAVLAANATAAPAFTDGLKGLARSMPTSGAVDRVAQALGLECFETPTGWKFFGNLLDTGRISLCGEESAGTSSDHVREKDGLWAVLLWLNILARTRLSVSELMTQHWAGFGRNFYTRHDYEAVDSAVADGMVAELRAALPTLPGSMAGALKIETADEFSYHDPVDGSVSSGQGLRIGLEGSGRIVIRLSGTGTVGATVRIYLERLETDPGQFTTDPQIALAPIIEAAEALTQLKTRTGRSGPDVIT